MVILMFLTGKDTPPTVITTDPCLRVSSSLTSTDVGFILVIDRRQDRWAAVKGTLLRIAVSDGGTPRRGSDTLLYSHTKRGGLSRPLSIPPALLPHSSSLFLEDRIYFIHYFYLFL